MFCYSLYEQKFLELSCSKKYNLTVGISQISESINTHGLGIMNSTINSIYHFISSKVSVFSQFLYDEHIKSQLHREAKKFKGQKVIFFFKI